MSAVQSLPLLLLLAAVLCALVSQRVLAAASSCGGGAVTAAGELGAPTDPTQACYPGYGTPHGTYLPNEFNSWQVVGIQSEYSSTLNVLCGFRAFYTNYSGTRGAWGAWHGSPFIDEGDFCTGQTSQKLADLPGDLVYSGTGSYATRTNPVDGRTIMVYYSIGSYCNTQEFICFGNCYRTPEMLADPTFRVHNISAADPSSNPLRHVLYPSADPTVAPEAAQVSVIERFNATAYNGTISWQGTQGNITAVTYIQACVGFGNPVCPAPANGSGNQTNASHPAQPQKLVDLRHKLMLRDE